ncbi:Oligosaccaryltransferase-domain-containing protein [Parachaetomium inaequale]|uniref:Dolichyl-diphosphooligosaccharide--protein glycosyltransferase subunit 4 n=1 Tax=Parachaetomium inaequale TaxID=2588326 RepID=A0AAN6SPB3_9PEZI|nr:Oligosaccaryltransferase-domain-containing protein [Parachaetomium inaequale]
MITDTELYRLAIVLGSAAMVLIILYHFFEVNSGEEESETLKEKGPRKAAPQTTLASTKTR